MGLTRAGFILIGLLSGGDYEEVGLDQWRIHDLNLIFPPPYHSL